MTSSQSMDGSVPFCPLMFSWLYGLKSTTGRKAGQKAIYTGSVTPGCPGYESVL